LYNTATRKKEIFRPLEKGKVGIYVCGVTVYDLCHIGHARSAIVFDVLVRYLRARGFDVTYVRNFTDLDDKIIERANKLGKDTGALAQECIDAFYEDMDRLYVLKADVEPRATEHIAGMIEMINALLERGYAYVEENDVFFSVEKFKEYGKLSGRKLDDMQAGRRIAVDEKKRHPMDFVLWKRAKSGEPQWPSPWGPGRPGWHIECSVMSNHYLGPTFDIHGGGKDLLFPHHENERAQSMGANNGNFANYWVHNGFVTVESEKMSKSLGNFLTIRDALEYYQPEVLRLFLLSKHYRSPLDFSKREVLALQSGLVRIYRTLQRLEDVAGPNHKESGREVYLSGDQSDPFLDQFVSMMDDDLNTAGAIGLFFEKVREMNRLLDSEEGHLDEMIRSRLENDRHHLYLAARILGILHERPDQFFRQLAGDKLPVDRGTIKKLIEDRNAARASKDWPKADEIRERLKGMGIILEDGPQGTTWRLDVRNHH
jgi:cysteinyl-tRNA synthetase